MELGNDEYFYAYDLMASKLSDEDKALLQKEEAIADDLAERMGHGKVSDEDIELAIRVAGVEA